MSSAPSSSPSSSQPVRSVPRRTSTLVPRSLHHPQSAEEFDELLTAVAKRSAAEEEARRFMQMQRQQQMQQQQQQKHITPQNQQLQLLQPQPQSLPLPQPPPAPGAHRSGSLASAASTVPRRGPGRELRDLEYTWLLPGPGEDVFDRSVLPSLQRAAFNSDDDRGSSSLCAPFVRSESRSASVAPAAAASDNRISDIVDAPKRSSSHLASAGTTSAGSVAPAANVASASASAFPPSVAAAATTDAVPSAAVVPVSPAGAAASSSSSSFVRHAASHIEAQSQQHIADQLELDQQIARSLEAEQRGRGPRTRRLNAAELLADSFVMDEIQILTFKLTNLARQHALDTRAARPAPQSSSRTIQPSQSNCMDAMQLFKTTFSNVSLETLTGYCSMILVDEHDSRLKKSNVSNRTGAGAQHEPYADLACACVLDMSPHLVCNQQVMRITFFATAEKYAGRGYAKLLCCHLKARAADISKRTGKEVTLMVMSLAHTLPFWTSKSMGFSVGGAVVQSLQAYNYIDTQGCSQPVLSTSLDALCRERLQCIENVRNLRELPRSELRLFPRFQQVAQKPKLKPKRKHDGKPKTLTKGSTMRNNRKGAVESDEDESEDFDSDDSDDSSDSSDDSSGDHPALRAPFLAPYVLVPSMTPPILLPGFSCGVSCPFAALPCEYERCLDLVALVMSRCCAIAMPGRPTVQVIHRLRSDFHEGEICVVALPKHARAIARSDDPANFTMERCAITKQDPTRLPQLVSVHLIDRLCESQRPLHALTPIWYLYKPRLQA